MSVIRLIVIKYMTRTINIFTTMIGAFRIASASFVLCVLVELPRSDVLSPVMIVTRLATACGPRLRHRGGLVFDAGDAFGNCPPQKNFGAAPALKVVANAD